MHITLKREGERERERERGGRETCLDAVEGSVDDTRYIALTGQLKRFEILVGIDKPSRQWQSTRL